MSALSSDKGNNNMLDLPWFYEINLSVVMKQHKVIKLNCWALVVDQNRYATSIWLKNAQKFKYVRNDFSTLFKIVDQFEQKYFDWNYTQNISNDRLAQNIKQLMQLCATNNVSNHSKPMQKQLQKQPSDIEQKQSDDRSQQELLHQLEIIKTKMENTKRETNNILPNLIQLSQTISSLQTNPNEDNKLKFHQQQNDLYVQQINENHSIYAKLEREFAEINQVYNKCHDEPQQNEQILTDILDTITPDTIVHVSKQIIDLDIINNKPQIQELVSLILQFAIKNIQFVSEYVQLFINLQSEYWDKYQNIIGETVVNKTRLLFIKSKQNQMNDKNYFLSVMELVAELYIVGLFRTKLVCKGVLQRLLPPTNKALSEIDMEGVCILLYKCGKLLEKEDKKSCDEFINTLTTKAKSFGGILIELVDDLKELRNNNWEKSALQEKYSVLKHQHKKLQIKYNKLHGKYIAIIKRSDYTCWNAKDIANWIVALNKSKYSKYCNILTERMENEGIDGKCLPDVDKDDLRRLGITNFKDNCDIYDSINQLVNKIPP